MNIIATGRAWRMVASLLVALAFLILGLFATSNGSLAFAEETEAAIDETTDTEINPQATEGDDSPESESGDEGGGSSEGSALAPQANTIVVNSSSDLRSAFTNARGEVTIDIQSDITLTKSGYNRALVYGESGVAITLISSNGSTLTRDDSLQGADYANVFNLFNVRVDCTLVLGEGLKIDAKKGSVAQVLSNAKLILDGAEIRNVGSSYDMFTSSFYVTQGGEFEIKSGSIIGGHLYKQGNNTNHSDYGDSAVIKIVNGGKVIISGGRIEGVEREDGTAIIENAGELEMTGGTIHGMYNPESILPNDLEQKGAIYVTASPSESATFTMSGDAVIENCMGRYGGVQCVSSTPGGAKAYLNGGIIRNNYARTFGGGVQAGRNSTVILDGTRIEGNEADSGAGIYVGGTTDVSLLSGAIVNNKARTHGTYDPNVQQVGYGTGGGITVASNVSGQPESGFTMHDVLVTGNEAGTIGGGAWLCPTGDVDSEISDGVAMFDNTAGAAGDDLAIVNRAGTVHKVDVIQNRMLGGGVVTRYLDGNPIGADDIDHGEGESNSIHRYSAGNRTVFDYVSWDKTSSVALHNAPGPAPSNNITEAEAAEMGDNSKEIARQRAKLIIEGNAADNAGGGIACNGHIWVGDDKEKSIVVKKAWSVPTDTQLEDSVTIYLDIDGEDDGVSRRVEKVILNAGNNWTHTFMGLPPKAAANLQEAALTHSGWVAYYYDESKGEATTDDGVAYHTEEDITVTNARSGKLEISKAIEGDQANPETEFAFNVTITDPKGQAYETRDGNHHPAAMDFSYEGDAEGVLEGGVGTILLKGSQKVTINDIPHGALYTVTETAGTADGYEIEPSRNDGATGSAAESGTITGDATVSLSYLNVKGARMGSLQISKAISGDAADPEKEFAFKVSLRHPDGTELTEGLFAYVGDREGIISSGGTVSLKAGQTVRIDGLPTGTTWEVKEVAEEAAGYEIEPSRSGVVGADAETGTIETAKTAELSYMNIKNSTMGSLKVSKALAGDAADPDKAFRFQVRFYNGEAEITGDEFPFTGDESGIIASGGTFALKGGEEVVVSGLPEGTTWTVQEVVEDAHGYEVKPSRGEVTGPEAETGVISPGETTALAYVNEKDSDMGTLTIEKMVTGKGGDLTRDFQFTIAFADAEGNAISDAEFAYTGDREGFIASGGTIELRHGQKVTVEGLPAGTAYTVSEIEVEGYEAKAEGTEGTIGAGFASSAKVTNVFSKDEKRNDPADPGNPDKPSDADKKAPSSPLARTGDDSLVLATLMAAAATGALAMLLTLRKRRE